MSLTGPYAYASYNRSLFLLKIKDELANIWHLTIVMCANSCRCFYPWPSFPPTRSTKRRSKQRWTIDFIHRTCKIIKFSTSDNAILAFWLVRCISVTSDYTYVWPYMEINAANVPWHKIFCGKPSSVGKKWRKKSKFGELSTDEI